MKVLSEELDKVSNNSLINIEKLKDLDDETKENLKDGNNLNNSLTANISGGTNINNSLVINIQNANKTNTSLVNNSNIATTKNIELQQSLDETKRYIDNLDGSQNLPQMRSDITDLQNGMKNNQNISYEGTSLTCNNTLNGRTEGMIIRGCTLQNLINMSAAFISTSQNILICNKWELEIGNTISKFTIYNLCSSPIKFQTSKLDGSYNRSINVSANSYLHIELSSSEKPRDVIAMEGWEINATELEKFKKSVLIFSGYIERDIEYFEGIKSVGDLNNNKINILSTGKNLWDSEFENNAWSNETGKPINASGYIRSKDFVSVNPNQYYYMSNSTGRFPHVQFRDGNGNFISSSTNVSGSFLTPDNCYKISVNYIGIAVEDISKVLLEKGKIKTEFEQYISDKKEILLPISDGLKGLPNGVCDKIYEKGGKVVLEQNIGKLVLNGDGDWISLNGNSAWEKPNTSRWEYVINKPCNLSMDTINLLNSSLSSCSYGVLNTQDVEGIGMAGSPRGTHIAISILKSKLETQDVAGFKKWLQANPTTVYYQLVESVYHDITNLVDIDLDTYDGLTYVNSENGIKPILDFQVPSNLASIVQSNSKAINELYELIDKLLIPNITNNTMNIALK